jgi:hypothetical protein
MMRALASRRVNGAEPITGEATSAVITNGNSPGSRPVSSHFCWTILATRNVFDLLPPTSSTSLAAWAVGQPGRIPVRAHPTAICCPMSRGSARPPHEASLSHPQVNLPGAGSRSGRVAAVARRTARRPRVTSIRNLLTLPGTRETPALRHRSPPTGRAMRRSRRRGTDSAWLFWSASGSRLSVAAWWRTSTIRPLRHDVDP